MTIRAIIKTSNLVQLGLVLLLGVCFFWLGRDLREVNGLLHNFYRIDALLSELGGGAADKYRLALDYVSAPNESRLEEWQALLLAERGDVGRPSGSLLKGEGGRSLQEIANSLDLDKEERSLLQFCLEQNELLSRLTEIAVMRARGLFPDARGGFSIQGAPQPKQALQWVYDTKLARIPDKISNAGRQLRAHLYQDFLAHMSERKRALWWMLGLAVVGLGLLAVNVAAGMFVFHKRVVRPLGLVGRYAEDVAAGNDPAPLRLKYGDELAGMFGSLQKMKSALLLRIQELKTAETAAHASRKQALQARAQALSSLRIAQKASSVQEDFLRRISHEVRTPMNAIIGMSYLCLQTELGPGQRKYLSQINKSGSVLLDMFNRILDFASVDEGSLRPELTLFPLGRFLDLLRQSVAAQAAEKKLSLALHAAQGLPARLLGDERHLEEVLRILLDNAVQYTAEGGVELSVAPLPDAAAGKVRLRFCVADSGPGISGENQAKLFEPFVPGDMSMTRSGSGLGLGLALARHLVKLMGGEITVDSAPGRGSRLSFDLEFDLPPDVEEDDPLPVPDGGERGAGVVPPVLVVDDNEINRQIAKELLEQAGLAVTVVGNGREAVEYVRRQPVSLVLMDVQMPVMDGLEATCRIRELGRSPEELPILAMTAHADKGSRMDGKSVGMNDYLTKPVNPAELYAALDEWLPGGLARNPVREAAGRTSEEAGVAATPAPVPSGDRQAVNIKAGLATVGGNEKLYNELLIRFVEHYGQSAVQLRELLARNDYRGAARLAHTVKGVAANLGVERVTELTRRMESSLPGVPPGEDLLRRFEAAMDEALERIRQLQSHSRLAVTAGDLRLAEEHKRALLLLLEELPRRMETDWGGVESALEAFIPLVEGTPYAEDLAGVLAAVNDFNPADMADRVERLRRHLRGEEDESRLLH